MIKNILFVIILVNSAISAQLPINNVFENGLAAKQRGDILKALEIWEEAYNNFALTDKIDPRIGLAFIETVTEQRITKRYEIANEMYYWALSADYTKENEVAYLQELDRLKPILSRSLQKELAESIKQMTFKTRVRALWNRHDPTPSTDYNERLLEHWERLSYVKQNYSNGRSLSETVRQDARAEIYLKYGKPEKLKEGILTLDVTAIDRYIRQQQSDMPDPANPLSTTNALATNISNIIEQRVKEFHQNPMYEIWIYKNETQHTDKAIYVFGSFNGGKNFTLKNTIEDFIPMGAYSLGARNQNVIMLNTTLNTGSATQAGTDEGQTGGGASISELNQFANTGLTGANITPAIILQLLYYQEFSTLDEFFGNRFVKMLSDYVDPTSPLTRSLALSNRQSNNAEIIAQRSAMPLGASDYEDRIRNIEIELFPYRFINEQDIPVTTFFLNSKPYDAFAIDFILNDYFETNKASFDNYSYKHTLQLYDSNWNIKSRLSYTPFLEVDFDGKSAEASSLFSIPYTSKSDIITVTAELFNSDVPDELEKETSPFDKTLRGKGVVQTAHLEALEAHVLEVSDIILGTDLKPELSNTYQFPFVVNHGKAIPKGKDLVMYFEVYGLRQNNDNFYGFDLEYKVKSTKKGLFGFKKEDYNVTLTISFETDSNRFSESVEIGTSNLEPGDYNLEIKIIDKVTKEVKTRDVNFSIN